MLDFALVFDANHERRNVDQLVVDGDVSVLYLGSSVVDGLGELGLENSGLKSSLKEFVHSQTEAVIELVLLLRVEKSISEHSVEEGSAFELSNLITFIEGEQGSGSLSDLGQGVLNSPDFSLVLQSVVTALLNFGHNPFLLERPTWGLVCGRFWINDAYRFDSS